MAFRSVPSGLTDDGIIRLPSLSVLIPALLDSGGVSDGIFAIACRLGIAFGDSILLRWCKNNERGVVLEDI